MPARIHRLGLLTLPAALVFAITACTEPLVVVATPTADNTPTAASVLDDGTEAQDLQDPTATPDSNATPLPTIIAVTVAPPTAVPTRADPSNRRPTATTQARPSATPDRIATRTRPTRVTATPTPFGRPTSVVRATATRTGNSSRATATPTRGIPVRATSTPTRTAPDRGTATPVSIPGDGEFSIQGAVTAGGGTSVGDKFVITGAMGTFAGFSTSDTGNIESGPLAPIIAASP